jgi:hypothetical protein
MVKDGEIWHSCVCSSRSVRLLTGPEYLSLLQDLGLKSRANVLTFQYVEKRVDPPLDTYSESWTDCAAIAIGGIGLASF